MIPAKRTSGASGLDADVIQSEGGAAQQHFFVELVTYLREKEGPLSPVVLHQLAYDKRGSGAFMVTGDADF